MSSPNGDYSAEHQATLAAVLEHAVDAIITIDEGGIVTSANPAMTALFGYASDEVVGQNVNMLMPSPYQEEHDGYLANYLRTGERKIIGIAREVVGRRKDGTTFPMHLAVSEVQVGERCLFAGVMRDISGVKEKQACLEAIFENAVDAIITIDQMGIVEVVNPATQKLFGYTEQEIVGNNVNTLMPFPYRDEHDGYLQNYLDVGERNIIGIGREVVGRRKDGTTFPMHLAVSEVTLGNRRIFTGIEAVGETDLHCHIDAFRTGQVFRNLFENSFAACGDSPCVQVHCEQNGDGILRFTVRDNGPGLSSEQQQKVFQPFFTTKAKGTGLGMAIVKRIVESHGGQIRVGSDYSDGAEFVITLPTVSPL